MAKTVVVLGGAYAGVHIAHYLLKYLLPTEKDLKVILVTKNDHFYWNMASVRAIVPGVMKDEVLLRPLAPGFAKYPPGAFELVVGTAEASDLEARTVRVSTAADGGERTLSYDHLVLATGARTASPGLPWKAEGTHAELVAQLHGTAERVRKASHIVVAGAGPTGVETAGELAFEYGAATKKDGGSGGGGPKEVVLLSADASLLGGDAIGPNAAAELKKLGVKVRYDARVQDVKTLPDGRSEIALVGGETITTDLYLPTFGLVPNSEYVDKKYLSDKGYALVDEFYHLKGHKDVWAVGDIVSVPRAGFMITQKTADGVAKNITAVIKGKEPAVVKGPPMDVFAASVGRSRGVGRMGSIKLFSLMVYMAKGRTLATQMLPGYVDGSAF